MMARRGVELEMVHFVSPPYTSPQAQEKVLELARLLTGWCGRMLVHIIPFTDIQEEIRKNCPEEYFTLIMRRFMMRLAQAVAAPVQGRRPGHRRVPGPGGQPDHAGPGHHRRRVPDCPCCGP